METPREKRLTDTKDFGVKFSWHESSIMIGASEAASVQDVYGGPETMRSRHCG